MIDAATCWTMSAQAPSPASAAAIPQAPATSVAAISRSSRLRKSMSLVSRASWVEERDAITNVSDIAAKSGSTSGSP